MQLTIAQALDRIHECEENILRASAHSNSIDGNRRAVVETRDALNEIAKALHATLSDDERVLSVPETTDRRLSARVSFTITRDVCLRFVMHWNPRAQCIDVSIPARILRLSEAFQGECGTTQYDFTLDDLITNRVHYVIISVDQITELVKAFTNVAQRAVDLRTQQCSASGSKRTQALVSNDPNDMLPALHAITDAGGYSLSSMHEREMKQQREANIPRIMDVVKTALGVDLPVDMFHSTMMGNRAIYCIEITPPGAVAQFNIGIKPQFIQDTCRGLFVWSYDTAPGALRNHEREDAMHCVTYSALRIKLRFCADNAAFLTDARISTIVSAAQQDLKVCKARQQLIVGSPAK